MNSKRFYYLMIGLTCLLAVAIIGSAFFANMLLKQQSKKLYSLKLTSQVLDQQQIGLAQAKRDIKKYSDLKKEAQAIVPQDKDQAEAVREIIKIAKSTGVNISSIAFPTSTLGNSPVKSSASTNTTPSPTTAKKTPTVSQTQLVPGLKGVYLMPITIEDATTAVPYTNFINFLDKLEQNRRTAQVSSVNIQPTVTDPGLVNFTLIVNTYIKP